MIELLLKRRSCRDFKPQKIEAEKIEKLIQAALLGPTANNQKSCSFVMVEDPKMLEILSRAKKSGGIFLGQAALGFIVIGNTDITNAWVEDASIAAINIQLEAETLGLGSCWIQIRNRPHSDDLLATDFIKKHLDIPDNFEVLAMIAVGYKAAKSTSHTLEALDMTRMHLGKF